MKNIVITGSSRGIGYGLAKEFLKKGHRVTISGRNEESLKEAVSSLTKECSNSKIAYAVCNVTVRKEVKGLWEAAATYGSVDIWVNNAGLGQGAKPTVQISDEKIDSIIDTNIKGLISCCKIALEKMLEQGSGAIYNMEGFGSDGRKMKTMTIYGTSKYAVRYFTRSLALESKGTPVIVGAISPGMVVTDLLTSPLTEDNPVSKEALKIFHILADDVGTVTPFLVRKMLENKKNGAYYNWLNSGKVMKRFIRNIFIKRRVDGLPDIS